MARGSHSHSRSPGPWRTQRDRDGGAMAFVGPPPSRSRGHTSFRPSRPVWGDQSDGKADHNGRGGKTGVSDNKDVYYDSSRGVRHGGGGSTMNAHKRRGSTYGSWQAHTGEGDGGGRTTRGSVDDGGRGRGDVGGTSSRRSPTADGRGFPRVRSSSSSRRRSSHRDGRVVTGSGGGSAGASGYPDYFDTTSSTAVSSRGHATGESIYETTGRLGGGSSNAAAAAAPSFSYKEAMTAASNAWRGDRSQKGDETDASIYNYYVGGSSNADTQQQQQQQQQQQFERINSTARVSGSTDRTTFDSGASPVGDLNRGAAEPTRGGFGAAQPATGGGTRRQPVQDDEERLLEGPLLNFKQFVVMKPDECTQKELSRAYEAYVERYKRHHAEQFYEKFGGHAFMRELYHPNTIRRQHELRKARAKVLAQAFLQKYQRGFFNGLALKADSREIRRFYLESEEDSPLLLKQWPTRVTIGGKGGSSSDSGEAEVVEIEDDVSEEGAGGDKRHDDLLDEPGQVKKRRVRGGKDEDEAHKIGNDGYGHRHRSVIGGGVGGSGRRRSSAFEGSSGDDAGDAGSGSTTGEGLTQTAPIDPRSKRWPPYVLLPSAADCLVIHAVDPSISSLDIFDELASKGEVIDVAMIPEGDDPTAPRTAFIFFSSSEAKRNYKQSCPDTNLKLTKPVVTVGPDGEEQETLKIFSLSLCEPPMPSVCEACVTPPACCTPSRLRKDLETSAALILELDRQLGVFEEESADNLQHPLLSSFPESWSVSKRLDLQITYLRQVHALCYYSGELCKDLVDVNLRCGKAYLRPQLPAPAEEAMYLQLEQQQNTVNSTEEGGEESGSSDEEDEGNFGVSVANLRKESGKGRKRGKGGGSGRRRSSSARHRSSSSSNGAEDEQQDAEMDDADERGDITANNTSKEHLCISRQQRRWMRQLDQKLLMLLRKIEKMQERLPAALEEDTPIISLKWSAFCHEKVFEDDEHKHRCRLCNKPFKAPHFVFKHLRKKHEEELNFIIERVANIVMKEAYMKDPAKPLVLAAGGPAAAGGGGGKTGENSTTAGGGEEQIPPNATANNAHEAPYAWGGYAHSPAPTPAPGAAPGATAPAAAGWPSSLAPGAPGPSTAAPSMQAAGAPPPYGVMFVPERNVSMAGTHPMYAAGAAPHPGGILTHPMAPPSSQYYPFGGAFVPPPHVVYGGAVTNFGAPGAAVITLRRRDWDAPEPVAAVLAPAGGAARQLCSPVYPPHDSCTLTVM